MANITERVSASQYRFLMRGAGGRFAVAQGKSGRNKYLNQKTSTVNGHFDSRKEARTAADLELARLSQDPALRVIEVLRQQKFLLIPKQDGERAASYVADFVVIYADQHQEVLDTKSVATRTLPAYVLKRKLMLSVHGIRVREV